ncbi:MAG: phage major capsid protein [Rikenellaceae bacterium]|nr:phage major capsid protein [Rikenellaceae bacterium]
MRIDEINTRLAAIQGEIDTASGEALTALETEVAELTAERQRILDEVQTRQQLRSNIAAGLVTGEIIEKQEEPKMENRTFTLASEEYRGAFLRHLRGEEMSDVEKRAFTFLTTNTSKPLPTVMLNRIIDLIGEAHPIVADVYRMDSNSAITIPVAKTVAADAGKTAEGAASNELEITFDSVDLSGDDYTANINLSYKMQNMAIPAFEDYIVTQIAARLGAKIAADIVANIKAGMADGNKVATGVNYANICAGFGELKRVGTVTVYGTRKGVYNKLVGMVDSQKRPIFQQAITAGAAGALLGCTIKFEDAVGDDELLIGDPKKYLQNVVAPVVIESDKDLKNHTVVYSGYTCQQGTLTDDRAFALVSEA